MTIVDFDLLCKGFAMKKTVSWRWPEEPISLDKIREMEEMWGVELPKDYVECALENHGGHPTPNAFNLTNRPEAVFSHLLDYVHVVAKDKDPSIKQVYMSIRKRLPVNVFPFAADPFGNFICFDYRRSEESPCVVFWDHEVAFNDRERALTVVCKTFSELLGLLFEAPNLK